MGRVNATRTIGGVVVAVVTTVIPLVACSQDALIVPPDRSITEAEYSERGLPALDNDWSTEEWKQAWDLLQGLYAQEPSLLPRYGSPRSGPVFDKLLRHSFTMEGVLAALGDLRVGELESILEEEPETLNDLTLLGVYTLRPETGLIFDLELVEILAFTANETVDVWRDTNGHIEKTNERLAGADLSGREEIVARIRESQERLKEALASTEGLFLSRLVELISLSEVPGVSATAKDSALAHVDRLVAEAWDFLSEDGRAAAKEVLAVTRTAEVDRKQ